MEKPYPEHNYYLSDPIQPQKTAEKKRSEKAHTSPKESIKNPVAFERADKGGTNLTAENEVQTPETSETSDAQRSTFSLSFFKKWGSLVVLGLALSIIIIDTTLLNVSLSTLIDDLDTDLKSLQWVITAYSLTLAALTITGGRIGDLFGRKKMFMLGAIIFAIGSYIASISTNVGTLHPDISAPIYSDRSAHPSRPGARWSGVRRG